MASDVVASENRAAYAAAAWMVIFAAMSFYWAAGGMVGAETLGPAISDRAEVRDPDFVAVLWATAVAKLLGAGLALALVQPCGRRLPRRLLLTVAWAAAGLILLYGAANLVQHALMVTGVLDVPAGLGRTAARWHLFFWDPFWLLGGGLLAAAAARFGQRSRRT